MRPAILVVVFLTLLAPARAAHAADQAPKPRPTTIYGTLGLGTPLGYAGLEVERSLFSHLAVAGGVGLGSTGPQAEVAARSRFGTARDALVLGAGLSGGKYTWFHLCYFETDCAQKGGTVGWLNLEIGGESKSANGFSFRYFAGYGRVIAGNLICQRSVDHCSQVDQDDGYNIVFTGVGFGWGF